jgi:hypothetical protein
MNDEQIYRLKELLVAGKEIYWYSFYQIRRIYGIGTAPCREGDVPEPSEVGFFSNGEYVALYNCEPQEFVTLDKIF